MTQSKTNRQSRNKATQLPQLTEMEQYINKYFLWMEVTNYSPETIISRKLLLKYFRLWCEDRGIYAPFEVSIPVVESYQKYLHFYIGKYDKRISKRSQRDRLTGIKMFFLWLFKSRNIPFNPVSDIDMPRTESPIPRSILSIQEVEKIINQVDLDYPMGLRDRAILETLYSTGIRRFELCNLKIDNIDFDKGLVMVILGKYRKDRLIPIGERALLWIDKYIWELRNIVAPEPDNGILFLTKYGKKIRPPHLTRIVRQYIDDAEIKKEGSCHIFRHTMATLMLENGADTRFIQHILGHVSLKSTQIYTRVAIGKLKEVHTRTHPGAKNKRKEKDIE